MKNTEEFKKFLRDYVNLNQSRIDELDTHIEALSDYLRNNHPGFGTTEKQGSYALRTIIRPSEDGATFDADVLVMMQKDSEDCASYVNDLHDTLKKSDRYKDKLEIKNKCVTINYAESTKCNVDLVPCVKNDDRYYVCPRDGDFVETDGTGYRQWFNSRNSLTNGNLKRTVRLLKQMRDHQKKIECQSIILTTLAGEAIRKTDESTESVRTEADTVEAVLNRVASRVENTPYPPEFTNPALASETFSHGWTNAGYERFRKAIREMADAATAAKNEQDREESIKKWQKIFGEQFTESDGGGSSGGSSNSSSLNTSRPRPNHLSTAAALSTAAHRSRREAPRFG